MSQTLEGIQRRATETVTGLRVGWGALRKGMVTAFDKGEDRVCIVLRIAMFSGNQQ